jgi:hypothetical protein
VSLAVGFGFGRRFGVTVDVAVAVVPSASVQSLHEPWKLRSGSRDQALEPVLLHRQRGEDEIAELGARITVLDEAKMSEASSVLTEVHA